MKEGKVELKDAPDYASDMSDQGQTPIYVAVDGICGGRGVLAIPDPTKSDSKKTSLN